MKYFEFEDFTHDESGIIGEGDNTLTDAARGHIEEFVCRLLDPLWEAWDITCVSKDWESGISIRRAFIRKSICDTLPAEYRDYYRGYTAEIYPTNGRLDEFVSLLKIYAGSKRIHFNKIMIYKDYVKVEFKDIKGRMSKNIE